MLAEAVVAEVGEYAEDKIVTLEDEIDSAYAELESLDRRIEEAQALARRATVGSTDKLIALTLAGLLEQRRSAVEERLSLDRQLLALASDIERPRVVDDAAAEKTTARSKRNSLVVGGALGLLAGLLAALMWDWAATRVGRAATR